MGGGGGRWYLAPFGISGGKAEENAWRQGRVRLFFGPEELHTYYICVRATACVTCMYVCVPCSMYHRPTFSKPLYLLGDTSDVDNAVLPWLPNETSAPNKQEARSLHLIE